MRLRAVALAQRHQLVVRALRQGRQVAKRRELIDALITDEGCPQRLFSLSSAALVGPFDVRNLMPKRGAERQDMERAAGPRPLQERAVAQHVDDRASAG